MQTLTHENPAENRVEKLGVLDRRQRGTGINVEHMDIAPPPLHVIFTIGDRLPRTRGYPPWLVFSGYDNHPPIVVTGTPLSSPIVCFSGITDGG